MNIKEIPTDVLKSEIERREKEEKSSIEISPEAENIVKSIDYALVNFGEYTFSDKGPHEVINTGGIVKDLKNYSIENIGKILVEVLNNYEDLSSVGKENHAIETVNAIIGEFDSLPEDKFEELLEYDERFEY